MSDYVIKTVDTMLLAYHTRDPFELIELLNIYWSQAKLGRLKGYYRIINKERHIVTNEDLCEFDLPIVLAHEIAHDRLHRHIAITSPMKDFALFDYTSVLECQANTFAAELLIEDNTVIKLAQAEGLDYFQICNELCITPALFSFKIYAMIKKGHQLNIPLDICSDYLKN